MVTENYLCFSLENGLKHNQHFKMLFFKINLHFVTLNLISTDRKLNFPLMNSSFLVFLRMQIETDGNVYYYYYYFLWKESTNKPFKSSSCKKPFSKKSDTKSKS